MIHPASSSRFFDRKASGFWPPLTSDQQELDGAVMAVPITLGDTTPSAGTPWTSMSR